MTPAQADAELARYRPGGTDRAEQEALAGDYRRALAASPGSPVPGGFGGSVLHRDGPPAHLTASALVLDETGRRTLLVLHRKAGAWLQPGGHLEPHDPSLAAAALREAREETGLGALLRPGLDGSPADLHHHALGRAFGRCAEHLDVAFLVLAPVGAAATVSPESEQVAWFDVADVVAGGAARDGVGVVADLPARLARVAALVTGAGR